MRDDIFVFGIWSIIIISIHVPRMRDDARKPEKEEDHGYFNPRPSHEGRLVNIGDKQRVRLISIHVPRMRDDVNYEGCIKRLKISIHVPRMRDDRSCQRVNDPKRNFNPRPSHEGRRDRPFKTA